MICLVLSMHTNSFFTIYYFDISRLQYHTFLSSINNITHHFVILYYITILSPAFLDLHRQHGGTPSRNIRPKWWTIIATRPWHGYQFDFIITKWKCEFHSFIINPQLRSLFFYLLFCFKRQLHFHLHGNGIPPTLSSTVFACTMS